MYTSLKSTFVAFADGRGTTESMPSPPLANSNHESPVNQLGNMQNMRLGPSFILTGIFLGNGRTEASPFFTDEFALSKIFPEYKRNLFGKFQTNMAFSLELDPPSLLLSVVLFMF
nr:RecName: Full=Uncharacterized protein encoded by LINC02876; AltName: Full=Long intergenic non-protein coding RNA 2876 [Homo sapiens]|eukprot:NP_001230481.1 uncharacterized protein C17orf112 [Homo sapiens]